MRFQNSLLPRLVQQYLWKKGVDNSGISMTFLYQAYYNRRVFIIIFIEVQNITFAPTFSLRCLFFEPRFLAYNTEERSKES